MIREEFRKGLENKLGAENLRRIEESRIGIAGAGGLGSNCAAFLVRSGFRKLTIVDFDVVSAANLDRQFYFNDQVGMVKVEALAMNLLRINPDLELQAIKKKIEKQDVAGLFGACAVVAECFDRAENKRMLVEALLFLKKPVVSVSGLGGVGNSDDIRVRKAMKNLILIGDMVSDIENAPALSPRVSLAAAKQADSVLELVLSPR